MLLQGSHPWKQRHMSKTDSGTMSLSKGDAELHIRHGQTAREVSAMWSKKPLRIRAKELHPGILDSFCAVRCTTCWTRENVYERTESKVRLVVGQGWIRVKISSESSINDLYSYPSGVTWSADVRSRAGEQNRKLQPRLRRTAMEYAGVQMSVRKQTLPMSLYSPSTSAENSIHIKKVRLVVVRKPLDCKHRSNAAFH